MNEIIKQLALEYGEEYARKLLDRVFDYLVAKYGQGVTKEQIEAERALLLPVPPKSDGTV